MYDNYGRIIETKKEGYIYVLSNPDLKDIYKIGRTGDSVQKRIRELSSTTSLPLPFKEVFSFLVPDMVEAEALIHKELENYRYVQNKEFFKADINIIKNALGCLFPQYNDLSFKLRDYVSQIGKSYYRDNNNLKGYLDANYETLKKNNFNLECFANIYKKDDIYYRAQLYCELCKEEDLIKWIKEKEQPIITETKITVLTTKVIQKTISLSNRKNNR